MELWLNVIFYASCSHIKVSYNLNELATWDFPMTGASLMFVLSASI